MLKLSPIVLMALSVMMLASCASLTPLTENLKQNNSLTTDQLKHIQFYLSDDIMIQRKLKDGANTEIAAGKVKIINGERVEEVIFKAGTPGVLMAVPSDNKLAVSFEDGDNRTLMFIPNPARNGKFVLAATDWKNGVGKLTYDGREFYCNPESGNAYLEIDLKKLHKVQHEVRKASGRKVDSDSPTTTTPAK